MIIKNTEKKQKVLRVLFGTLSATAMMFVFQACPSSPQNRDKEMAGNKDTIQGVVTVDGEKFEGFTIECKGEETHTNSNGEFYLPVEKAKQSDTYSLQVLYNDNVVATASVSVKDVKGTKVEIQVDPSQLMPKEDESLASE